MPEEYGLAKMVMNPPAEVYLGLGSNLGDRVALLKGARQALQALPLANFQTSSIYESVPYKGAEQPLYYNQVVKGSTSLDPDQLLVSCQTIEEKLGRIRTVRSMRKSWEPRLIDIDILYYEDLILKTNALTIPHADLTNRGFVLMPLVELSPHWSDPGTRQSMMDLFRIWQAQTTEPLPVRIDTHS